MFPVILLLTFIKTIFYQMNCLVSILKQILSLFNYGPLLPEQLKDDFGHGLDHAVKVAVDAGALMIIENKLVGSSNDFINRRVIIVQCAALLHDIKRKQENHAVKGAAYARKVLKRISLRS